MAGKIKAMWTNKDIRNRILFTLFAFLVYRLGSAITVPDVNTTDLVNGLGENSLFAMLNLLGGGGLEQFSVFALGVTPYITASIIIQLLSMDVIPHLTELSKAGANGRKTLDKYTRYLAVVFAFVQSFSLVYGFSKAYTGLIVGGVTISKILYIATIFAAGSMFLVWIGDQISMKGIGNGISIILLVNIVSGMPGDFTSLYNQFMKGKQIGPALIAGCVIVGVVLAVVVFVIVLSDAERHIPVQYSKKMQGRKLVGGQQSKIPLKVNTAGVIPIIFASSIMQFPIMLQNVLKYENNGFIGKALTSLNSSTWFDASHPKRSIGLLIYIVLVVLFAYFYTSITFNPLEISNNMKKQGGFIPGIRPGKPTVDYLNKILKYIIFIGAAGLTIVAVVPFFFNGVFGASVSFGGTSIIIVVGVILETIKQIQSQLLVQNYSGFLSE